MITVTVENFREVLEMREVRDVLNAEKHPVQKMDDSGYTFLDYVLFKTKQHNRPLVKLVKELNEILSEGKKTQCWM